MAEREISFVGNLFMSIFMLFRLVYCTPRNHQGTFATGKIRRNVKFAASWCVFLTIKKR